MVPRGEVVILIADHIDSRRPEHGGERRQAVRMQDMGYPLDELLFLCPDVIELQRDVIAGYRHGAHPAVFKGVHLIIQEIFILCPDLRGECLHDVIEEMEDRAVVAYKDTQKEIEGRIYLVYNVYQRGPASCKHLCAVARALAVRQVHYVIPADIGELRFPIFS